MKTEALRIFKNTKVLLSVILLLGLALRLVNLGAEPFWGDEILSLSIASHYQNDIGGLIEYLRAVEVHPPFYYFLLVFWIKLFGLGEAAVRSLSLLFGLLTIGLSYFLGKTIFGKEKFGLIAALLVALMPMQIEYSQEARPYVIYTFFGLFSYFFLLRYFSSGRKSNLILFSIFSLLGLYLHYSYILLLAPLMLLWLVHAVKQRDAREALMIGGISAVIFLGFYWWLDALLMKIELGKMELLALKRSGSSIRSINLPDGALNQLVWTLKDRKITQVEIFSVLAAKILLFSGLIKLAAEWGLKKFSQRFSGLFTLFAASITLFLFSPQSMAYTEIYERHILWLSVLAALALAGIIGSMRLRHGAVVLSVLLISMMPFTVKIMANDADFDLVHSYKAISEYINANYEPGDIVIDNFSYDRTNLNFYLDKRISAFGFYPPALIDWQKDLFASRETFGLMENEAQSRVWPPERQAIDLKMRYLLENTEAKRVWLAFATIADYGVGDWLERHGWRHAFGALGNTFPLDLYVKR